MTMNKLTEGAAFEAGSPRDGFHMEAGSGWLIGAGERMEGGSLDIKGEAGPYAGRQMTGGFLRVRGYAGEGACASMQGGIAIFESGVASGLGERMRRGVIAVYGKAEGDVLPDMLGGTVLLIGGLAPGAHLLEGMNRGTVILPDEADVPPYFERTSDVDLVFLRYLFRQLEAQGVAVPKAWFNVPFTRWRGDMAALGKGEIFTPAGTR